jgi:hypothetical protein
MSMLKNIEELISKELNIEKEVIRTYIKLLLEGSATKDELGVEKRVLDKLIEYGSCIEINGMYKALNPKFAITNMYRMACVKENKDINRNPNIDKVATMLEGLVERRTK